MAWEQGDTIEDLLPFEEPVSVISVDINRDGGSVEVTLRDAHQQLLELLFDSRFGRLGRLYIQAPSTHGIHPIAQNSQAEREIVRLLRQHVDQNYSAEEQQRLTASDGRAGFHNMSERDQEGYLLLRCLDQVEELRKLALFRIIERA